MGKRQAAKELGFRSAAPGSSGPMREPGSSVPYARDCPPSPKDGERFLRETAKPNRIDR